MAVNVAEMTTEMSSALSLLVDPTQAMQAAQRLYGAAGQGLRHSGWNGCTIPRSQIAASRVLLDNDLDD